MADNRTYASVSAKRLKTDLLSTDVVFKTNDIVWYKENDGDSVNLSSSNFGTVGYGVWEPDNDDRREFFTWDPTTIANYTTTGISILSRGLVPDASYTTESSARKFFHPAGSKVLLSTNSPAFYDNFTNKNNNETITEIWTFNAAPSMNNNKITDLGTPTANSDAANKSYVDGVAVAGASNANTTTKGIIEIATVAEQGTATATGGTGAVLVPAVSNLVATSAGAGDASKIPVLNGSGKLADSFLDAARTWSTVQSFTANNCQITNDADSQNDAVRQSYLFDIVSQARTIGTAGETLALGDWIYLKASDGRMWKADADADESTYSVVGVALTSATAGNTVYYARPNGVVTGLTGLTTGSYYFLSGTAGAISATPHATRYAKVAQALSTTSLRVIEPKFIRYGSQSITSATTFAQTTGFYPGRIDVRAAHTGFGISIGDDSNRCVTMSGGGSPAEGGVDASLAWKTVDKNSAATTNAGTITSKTQTGFTLNCSTYGLTATVHWVAESL